MTDPRLSDAATGLPPIEELGTDPVMLVLGWATGSGIAANDFTQSDEPCRYLHLRGLVEGADGPDGPPDWAQIHLAIPVSVVLDLAADLAKGSTESFGSSEGN